MLYTFNCANCDKRTTVEITTNARPKHCRRIECLRERRRNQKRFTKRQDMPVKKLKVLSGRICRVCGNDTGPNRDVCPKCLHVISRSISGSLSI